MALTHNEIMQIIDDSRVMVEDALTRISLNKFNWDHWFYDGNSTAYFSEINEQFIKKYIARNACGTTACVAGGAVFIPELMARGLTVENVGNSTEIRATRAFSMILYKDLRAEAFFNYIFYKDKALALLNALEEEEDEDDIEDEETLRLLLEDFSLVEKGESYKFIGAINL